MIALVLSLLLSPARAAEGRITNFPDLAAHVLQEEPVKILEESSMIVAALGLPPGLAHAVLIWRPEETTDDQGHLFIVLRRLGKNRELETSGIVLGTIKDAKRRRTRHYLLLDPQGEPRRAAVVTNDLVDGAETADGSERIKRTPLSNPALKAWLAHEREFYLEWRHRKGVKPVEKTGP